MPLAGQFRRECDRSEGPSGTITRRSGTAVIVSIVGKEGQ